MTAERVQAIIFDLGGVLTEVSPARASRLWHRRTGLPADSFERIFMSGRLKNGFNTGDVTESEFLDIVRQRSGRQVDDELIREVWCDILRPVPDMAALAGRLANRYPLAVLSDTDPIHARQCMDGFALADLFTVKVFSYSHGVIKPDPALFQAAVRGLGHPAGSCFFIDDRPGNVVGARKAGHFAHHFTGIDDLVSALHAMGVQTD